MIDMSSSHIFENPTELGTLTALNVRSPLAQVAPQKRQCDLVTDERLSWASTRNLWLWLIIFFFFFFFGGGGGGVFYLFIFFSNNWIHSWCSQRTVISITIMHSSRHSSRSHLSSWHPGHSTRSCHHSVDTFCQSTISRARSMQNWILLPTWYTHVEVGSDAENSIHYIPLP